MSNLMAFGKSVFVILAMFVALPLHGQLLGPDQIIVATRSVELKANSVIDGDVIVNEDGLPPVLNPVADLAVQRAATVAGDVIAESIDLGNNATVNGNIIADVLTAAGSASCPIRGCVVFELYTNPNRPPVFATLPPFQESNPNPAAADVNLPNGSAPMELEAGDYGDIVLGKNVTLILIGDDDGPGGNSGVYQIKSIITGDGAQVLFRNRADVRVQGQFDLGKNNFFGPEADTLSPPLPPNVAPITASEIVVYGGGLNGGLGGDPDDPNAEPPAARGGRDSTVRANFYVPNGTLWMDKGGDWQGGFIARDIRADASVQGDSVFVNRPPAADPQTVITTFDDGSDSITITLTGSDPEGGDLSFMVVSGPSVGMLANLTEIVPDPILVPINGDPAVDCGATPALCEEVQPPVTSATVEYSDNAANDPDSFVFKVTDPLGAVGMATVTINPDDPTPPVEPTISEVEAQDGPAETPQGTPVVISLNAAAPAVGEPPAIPQVTFSIVSGPSNGTLSAVTSSGLTSATTTYTPNTGPDFTGTDSFTFLAEADLTGDSDFDDPGESDTATITIEVVQLAPDREVTTGQDQPLAIEFSGGFGVGGAALSLGPVNAVFVDGAEAAGRVGSTGGSQGDSSDGASPPELVAAGVGVPDSTSTLYDFEQPQFPASGNVIGVVDGIDFDAQTFTSGEATSGTQTMTGSTGTFGTAVIDFSGLTNKPFGFSLVGLDLTVGEIIEIVADFTTGPNQTFNVDLGGQPAFTPINFSFSDESDTIESLTMRGTDGGGGARAWLIDDLTVEAGSSVSGTVRLQVEWDVSNLQGLAGDLVSASITVDTVKGANSSLDTTFFAGTAEQDGVLSASDFEAPVDEQNPVAVMPAGTDPVGTAGTFTFDVTPQLVAALSGDNPLDFFSLQARVDEQLSSGEGLQIRSTHPDNVAAFLEPRLQGSTPPPVFNPPLEYTITSLPSSGALIDPSLGTITSTPFTLSGSTVNYQPVSGFTGTTSFTYEVLDPNTSTLDDGSVFVEVVVGSCLDSEVFCNDGRTL